jgi:hypothetical protein
MVESPEGILDLDGSLFAEILEGEKRDDGDVLHASDLISCDYATKLRIDGHEELPFDQETLARFLTGHAIEQYVAKFIPAWAMRRGYFVTPNVECEYRGIKGHIDFLLNTRERASYVVVDVTTGAGPAEAKYSHKLKSAFYAVATGAAWFVEWPFQIAYGGTVKAQKAHWFRTADYVHEVDEAIERLLLVPKIMPPREPHEKLGYNKCGKPGSGKSYCQARCALNAAYDVFADFTPPTAEEIAW